LSSALVEGSAKASAISAELESYASTDFDRAQKIFAEEMDAESSYLRVLDSLQAQSKKGSDLAKILADLAKPPGLLQRAKDIDAFVQAFQTESAKQSCLQLQSSADVAQANADDAKSIADGLQVKAAALKAKLPPSPTAQEAAALATAQDKAKQAKDKSDQAATKATDAKTELEKNANYKKDTKKCQ